MQPSLIAYQAPGKKKGRKVLKSLVAARQEQIGGRARLLDPGDWQLRNGDAAFWGVMPGTKRLFDQVRRDAAAGRRNYYYCDNAFFGRGFYFRIAKNRIQADGARPGDMARLAGFKIGVKPWRRRGRDIVVTLQTAQYMRLVGGVDRDLWLGEVMRAIGAASDRPVVVRDKPPVLRPRGDDFKALLKNAHCLVTWNSATAVEALLCGIPAIVLGPSCCAPVAGADLAAIEDPPRPDGRKVWAASLASQQWTFEEIRAGDAWRYLQEHY